MKTKPKPKTPKMTQKERGNAVRALSMFSQIGITIVVCVLLGVFIGRWLDNLFGTAPWLLLLFTFSGAGAAFKFLYSLSKRF